MSAVLTLTTLGFSTTLVSARRKILTLGLSVNTGPKVCWWMGVVVVTDSVCKVFFCVCVVVSLCLQVDGRDIVHSAFSFSTRPRVSSIQQCQQQQQNEKLLKTKPVNCNV